jgi:hypothetical protein
MSNRWPGGLIRKTPVTPAGPYQTGAAPGVWSMADAAYWKKQGLWPTAGLNPASFISTMQVGSGTSAYNSAYGVAVDGDQNVYVSYTTSTYVPVLAKYSPAGALQWQKQYVSASGNYSTGDGRKLIYGADGYLYWQTQLNVTSGIGNLAGITKLDTSGNIVWQRRFKGGASWLMQPFDFTIDASGNVICAIYGNQYGASTSTSQVLKYNSSGVLQWKREISQAFQYVNNPKIAVNASGDIYLSGTNTNAGIYIMKLNGSDGTTNAIYRFGSTSSSPVYINSMEFDSSGNLYAHYANWNGGSPNGFGVMKLNSSMAVQWANYVSGQGGANSFTGIKVDSSGNAYASNYIGNPYIWHLLKFDTSGSLTWSRKINVNVFDFKSIGSAVAVSASKVLSTGSVNNQLTATALVVPTNGGTAGTYTVGSNAIVYADPALSTSATTVSWTSGSYPDTNNASSWTDEANDYAVTTSTAPISTTVI